MQRKPVLRALKLVHPLPPSTIGISHVSGTPSGRLVNGRRGDLLILTQPTAKIGQQSICHAAIPRTPELTFSMEAHHRTGSRVEPMPFAWINCSLAAQDEILVKPPQFGACEEGDDSPESHKYPERQGVAASHL